MSFFFFAALNKHSSFNKTKWDSSCFPWWDCYIFIKWSDVVSNYYSVHLENIFCMSFREMWGHNWQHWTQRWMVSVVILKHLIIWALVPVTLFMCSMLEQGRKQLKKFLAMWWVIPWFCLIIILEFLYSHCQELFLLLGLYEDSCFL